LRSIQIAPKSSAIQTDWKVPVSQDVGQDFTGKIWQYNVFKHFGFILYDGQKSIFFHDSDVSSGQLAIGTGASVRFKVVMANGMYRAAHVEVSVSTIASPSQRHSGVVKTVFYDKKFGFVFDDADGAQLFFHEKNMAPGHKFAQCVVGSKVSYRVGQNAKGNVAIDLQVET
jgi:cold shock CspA family protein